MKKYHISAIGLLAVTMVLAVGTMSTTSTTYATTGMGNCRDEPEGSDVFRKKIGLEMMTQMTMMQIEMDQEEQEDQQAIQDKAIR